jgi:hypothetical protein
MSYDDSRFRGQPGFRDEPDFRSGVMPEDAPSVNGLGASVYTPGAYPVSDYRSAGTGGYSGDSAYGSGGPGASGGSESTVTLSGRRPPSAAQLDDVFDDPEHGDPGRDRMGVHLMWELVLLIGVISVGYLLDDAASSALRGDRLDTMLIFAAAVGFVTLGTGLSLRAAAPNLALGPLAYGSALFFADNSDRGIAVTAGITAVIAILVGIGLSVMVVGFHVPAWAASLGAAFALMVWIQRGDDVARVANGAYNPAQHALYWFIGFAGLTLVGGLVGLVRPIRRAIGRFRPVADPAKRRGVMPAVLVSVALIGSCVLAVIAGVLLALLNREVTPTENGIALSGLGLGAALLGGTSAYGRRGGIAGSVLAVALIVLLLEYAEAERWELSPLAVAASTIFAGLVVTRLVEAFGRPNTVEDEEQEESADWTPPTSSSTATSSADSAWGTGARSGGWNTQLPARSTDDGWGPTDQGWGTR